MDALDFHHLDPALKSFTVSLAFDWAWEILRRELDKCELICANCHRAEHSVERDEQFMQRVRCYTGKLLL